MATRQQQRRGTSEQWSTANPILAAGEIGYESDTNEFRIGDGVNHWNNLSPFKNLEDLGGTLDDYVPLTQKGVAGGVATLDQYGSIPVNQLPNADALDAEVAAAVLAHKNLTQGIHGIDDTANLATITFLDDQIADAIALEITNRDDAIGASASATFESATDYTDTAITTEVTNRNSAIDTALSAANDYTDTEIGTLSFSVTENISTLSSSVSDHASDTTSVHGIADTSALATKTYADAAVSTEVTNRNTAITTHNSATTSVHGIADTAALATKVYTDNAVSTHESDTTSVHGIADTSALATKSYADNAVSTHEQDTTNIHGIADTSALATKAYADNAASTAVAAVIDAAPAALDTLNELAAALGDNENYATTVTNALALKAPLASPTFTGTVSGVTKSMVGLGSVENTADADKPVSSAAQTALDLKAPLASPTFTGTVSGVSATHVGLGNVDNTSDANKPISTATQTALDLKETVTNVALKAPLASPTFTGTVSGITSTMVGLGNVNNTADASKPVSTAQATAIATAKSEAIADATSQVTAVINGAPAAFDTLKEIADYIAEDQTAASAVTTSLSLKAPLASPTFTGTVSGVTKAHVGLGNVDNTADADKPVSTAAQTALDLKAPLASPTFTGTVSGVTKSMVGLANVDNTADADKPVSTATQTALDLKANLAGPTFTGTVSGITKTMVGLGSVDNTADTAKPVSTAAQTALDAKAPLASPALTGVPTAPTAAVATNTTQVATTAYVRGEVAALVNSAGATLDTLGEIATALGNDANLSTTLTTSIGLKAPLASPTFTGTVTVAAAGVAFTDGTQSKEGVPSRTPIIQKTASYTLSALTERDNMIEVSSATGVTLTIPTNATLALPIGTSIDILQTSTGQVTIAGAVGVTVNATPGLKLRTQWSGATLFKRATDTWVVYGDLSA